MLPGLQRDEEFREVILVACVDLIEAEDIFNLLKRRFDEAELDTSRHPQDRMSTQYKYVYTHQRPNRAAIRPCFC